MGQKVVQGTPQLADAIKSRRQELGLTIEEAATKAGVGIKTWCRYEAGESIRQDKAKGICKVLNWHRMVGEQENDIREFNLEDYKHHDAWSESLCNRFGEVAAISFVIGSDIVQDYIEDDLEELSKMPKGTHVGQLPVSMMQDVLPMQFLMRYDYDFLYRLKSDAKELVKAIKHQDFLPHSVIQEILLYIFVEESQFPMEAMRQEMIESGISGLDEWNDWLFDLMDDMDVVTCLYSDIYLTPDNVYHFDNWADEQFYICPPTA